MKLKWAALLLGLACLCGCELYFATEGETAIGPGEQEGLQGESQNYPNEMAVTDFYDDLSPYGAWIAFEPYGYVWQPRQVDLEWRPYAYGRWLWTDYGWTWVAQEEWGWITYHYGRWGWDDTLGWFWVPGTVWAPAWVSWRWGDLYIGWAPLPPEVEFVAGLGIRTPYDYPDRYWNFVEGRYFQYDDLDRYVLPFERNGSAVRRSIRRGELSLRDRQIFNDGLGSEDVQRLSRSVVSRHRLEDARSPKDALVRNDALRVFRPVLKNSDSARPKSYIRKEEVGRDSREVRAKEIEKSRSADQTELKLKESQDREKRLLEQSQQQEKADLKRRVEDERKRAPTVQDKQKAVKDGEIKAGELQKTHKDEKAKVEERHQQEKKVVKGTIKKKDGN